MRFRLMHYTMSAIAHHQKNRRIRPVGGTVSTVLSGSVVLSAQHELAGGFADRLAPSPVISVEWLVCSVKSDTRYCPAGMDSNIFGPATVLMAVLPIIAQIILAAQYG